MKKVHIVMVTHRERFEELFCFKTEKDAIEYSQYLELKYDVSTHESDYQVKIIESKIEESV